MNKKLLSIFVLVLILAFTTQAFASLTFTNNAITGTNSSLVDVGAGNTLSLQTANNGTITTGTGLFTAAGGISSPLFTGPVTALKSATTSIDVAAATAPTAGQVLTATNGTTATWQSVGSDTQVSFNDGGIITGNSILTFDKITNTLNIGDQINGTQSGRLWLSNNVSSGENINTAWMQTHLSGTISNETTQTLFVRMTDDTIAANTNNLTGIYAQCESNTSNSTFSWLGSSACTGLFGGAFRDSGTSSAGLRIGVLGSSKNNGSTGSSLGVVGITVGAGSGEKVGVLGQVVSSGAMNTSSVGVYAKIGDTASGGSSAPIFGNSVLVADNTSYTMDLITGRHNNATVFSVDSSGVATSTQFKLSALNTAPANATVACTAGEIRIASGYIYVCVATNSWQRSAMAAW